MTRATLAIVAAFAAIFATAETNRTATENWTRNRIREATNATLQAAKDYADAHGGEVQSVNGKTGTVVLAAADVHALPDTYTPPRDDTKLDAPSASSVTNGHLAVYTNVNGKVEIIDGGEVPEEADPVWNAQKSDYQPKLVSGTNIKTVNGNSLLGSGNIEIQGGGVGTVTDVRTNGVSVVSGGVANIVETDPSVADWAKNPNPAPVTDLSPVIDYTTAVSNKMENGKQDTISDLATIRSGAAAGASAVQPGDLAEVAMSGSYDDLADKPDAEDFHAVTYDPGEAELTNGLKTASGILSQARADCGSIATNTVNEFVSTNTTVSVTNGALTITKDGSVKWQESFGGYKMKSVSDAQTVNCEDHATTFVTATGTADLVIVPPATNANAEARDFIVCVNTEGTNALDLAAFTTLYANDASATNKVAQGKVQMLYFTEIKENEWLMGRQEVSRVRP